MKKNIIIIIPDYIIIIASITFQVAAFLLIGVLALIFVTCNAIATDTSPGNSEEGIQFINISLVKAKLLSNNEHKPIF